MRSRKGTQDRRGSPSCFDLVDVVGLFRTGRYEVHGLSQSCPPVKSASPTPRVCRAQYTAILLVRESQGPTSLRPEGCTCTVQEETPSTGTWSLPSGPPCVRPCVQEESGVEERRLSLKEGKRSHRIKRLRMQNIFILIKSHTTIKKD